MRRNVVAIGVMVLVIGAGLFFASPFIFKSSLNLSSLFPLNESANLSENQTVLVTSVPSGDIFAMVYNDSLSMPLAFNLNGISTLRADNSYAGEFYNTGNATVQVYLMNNYTTPVSIYYSSLARPVSGIVDALVLDVIGIVLLIGGGVTAVIGLLMKRRTPP